MVQRSRNQGEGSPEFPNMRQNKGRVYTVKKASQGEFGQWHPGWGDGKTANLFYSVHVQPLLASGGLWCALKENNVKDNDSEEGDNTNVNFYDLCLWLF